MTIEFQIVADLNQICLNVLITAEVEVHIV